MIGLSKNENWIGNHRVLRNWEIPLQNKFLLNFKSIDFKSVKFQIFIYFLLVCRHESKSSWWIRSVKINKRGKKSFWSQTMHKYLWKSVRCAIYHHVNYYLFISTTLSHSQNFLPCIFWEEAGNSNCETKAVRKMSCNKYLKIDFGLFVSV